MNLRPLRCHRSALPLKLHSLAPVLYVASKRSLFRYLGSKSRGEVAMRNGSGTKNRGAASCNRRLVALIVLAVSFAAPTSAAWGEDVDTISDLFNELAPPPANEALEQIPDLGRKLLALRSYVRAGSGLADRWSWTEEKIKAFQGSTEQQALLAEVAAVSAHFAEANPGYELYANTRVRSLDVQIGSWNRNESVGIEGAAILAAWTAEFGTDKEDVGKLDQGDVRR